MNPILQALSHRIAVKSAAENLRILKSQPNTTMQLEKIRSTMAASQAKIQALETENSCLAEENRRLKYQQQKDTESARVLAAGGKAVAGLKPSAAPRATASPQLRTATEFSTRPLAMSRAEFAKLVPADKSRFSKSGGKISN